jgi:asparagine synthase (glutamine-hydrolysing)
MTNQLLKDTDYMSMWNSVEVRVPFLDKELMQLIYSIHPDIRYSHKQIKHLLIKSFIDVLPEAIWNRPKQGFVFPFQHWFADSNLSFVNNVHAEKLKSGLKSGKTHWSRYWCYNLIHQTPNPQSAW